MLERLIGLSCLKSTAVCIILRAVRVEAHETFTGTVPVLILQGQPVGAINDASDGLMLTDLGAEADKSGKSDRPVYESRRLYDKSTPKAFSRLDNTQLEVKNF
ncbi:uncharacterized protein BJ212DRAFT_1306213 [Suillus subaureus]|uniref:Uncharacterized protein n=1 Tax=Suillus subaureus TaxID=48587 RepID=A0A9P7AXC8_9AGAM|nr:uncharacterized protein BJ212DRAFT_1306213 [Suillus subaureus]KAG1796561.1 hypothetical protein BJ212DRAFT_1306213 [Suillus subaureus]